MAKDNGFIELKKQIRDNEIKNLYLFFGDETYIKEVYIKKIKDLIPDGGFADFNHILLDEKDLTFDAIDDTFESYPMFSEKKLIIIKNSGIFSKPKEEIKNFWIEKLKNIPDYVTLLFDETAIDKRSSLYKQVDKSGMVVEFEYLSETDMIAWLEREARNHKKIISKNNAHYMVNICDSGLSYVKNELDKLINFCETEITLADIERIVSKSLSIKVFELTDAIMEKNADTAISIANDLKTVKESAFKILYLLSSTFDKMLHSKLMLKEGRTHNEIAEKTGLRPFLVRKYLDGAKKFSEDYLTDRIIKVAEIDLLIKEGQIPEWTALEQYILESVEKVN